MTHFSRHHELLPLFHRVKPGEDCDPTKITLTADPASITIAAGASGTVTVTASYTDGLAKKEPGWTCTATAPVGWPAPTTVVTGNDCAVTVTVPAGTAAGNYTVTVTMTEVNGDSGTTTFTVTVP